MSLADLKSRPSLYFVVMYLFCLAGGFFATPITFAIVFVSIVKTKFKLQNNSFALIIFAGLLIALASFITILYWITLLNQWQIINYDFNIFPATIFWIVEIFHFLILVAFIISLVRVIRFPFTPYSAIYASLYNVVHILYNGCPVSELQNYLSLQTENITPIDNIFWRGAFGTDTEFLNLLRVIFSIFSLALIYLGYKQFMKIPTDKWLTAWAEPGLEKYAKKKLA